MKILKIVGIVLMALILIVLGLGLVISKEYAVERSVVINKPRTEVFPLVSTLRNQEKWSPWLDYDPQAKVTYAGTDGAVGSTYAWDGNDDIGKGEQEIKEIAPGEMVHNEVRFEKPFASVGQVYFVLADEGDATKVTWKMTGEQVYPMNVMSLFMDGMLGKEFDKGLIKLKTLAEK
ncbi:SRPBCC family protein [Larkinella terrae]|uniref:Polyketide cyclase n=1 Tax=Larkinella terrae TaxID=2025311 RepID=A0A7K0EHN1_9BACT|nr:SRPBCC family protein [Larkinella terrae]MRS60968.1 polyketide cyclase [Larkinella terrae]